MNTLSVSRKTLEEWALCLSQGDISPRWEIEALLSQAEQPAVSVKEGWEFTRWSGSSPDAVKNAAMEVARLVYYRQREWPRREWDNIGQLETYSIAQLAKVIYPVLRDAWPQAQPEQPEAGRGVCSRCHGVDGDCDALMSDDPTACPCRCHEPQVQDEGPTPYEAEHPSEGNVGRYYGEAVGANTWDIYRPDGSFLAHIDRPGVFYAILDELNKLNATTRPQVQEAGRVRLDTACGDLYDRRG